MTSSESFRIPVQPDGSPGASALSVVAHGGGWAVKHKDSYLGALASLEDALMVMAALSDHAGRAAVEAAPPVGAEAAAPEMLPDRPT